MFDSSSCSLLSFSTLIINQSAALGFFFVLCFCVWAPADSRIGSAPWRPSVESSSCHMYSVASFSATPAAASRGSQACLLLHLPPQSESLLPQWWLRPPGGGANQPVPGRSKAALMYLAVGLQGALLSGTKSVILLPAGAQTQKQR